ncbi:hypothetical protein [Piscirickettsia salmonis]|uniref:hypothetical protein n=1 Tax=Piscirickettsia salmonis TaxID=1238 RepID=UPI001013D5DD|nr:hypothetical protein [Piscirickettsia salmonis]WGZ73231.1 hypothetical protein E3220_16670 [Piscirickettsia salmonis]
MPTFKGQTKVDLGFAELQDAAAVCTSLVCTLNIELFEDISMRWLDKWEKTLEYKNSDKNKLFKKVWTLFYSNFDSNNGSITSPCSMVKVRNKIKSSRIKNRKHVS